MRGPALLVVSGLVAAYAPVYLGWPDLPLGVAEALLGAGALWAVWEWYARRAEARSRRRGVVAALVAAVAVFHAVWLVSLSAYGPAPEAPAVGARAPAISGVRVRDGATFELAAQREHATLLVFFRGSW